jgi:hypothetical protein
MNPVLGDAIPLKLIPGFVGVLEFEEDEETISRRGPSRRTLRSRLTRPTLRATPMPSPL